MEIKEIDGSLLEGGGQILRVCSTLSSILNIPVHITKIRAGRKTPGLSAQHSAGITTLTKLTDGHEEGNTVGSVDLNLTPGTTISQDTFKIDIGTAGAITLVIQSLLPTVLFSGSKRPHGGEMTFEIVGGTNVSFSPPIDHLYHVLLPILQVDTHYFLLFYKHMRRALRYFMFL